MKFTEQELALISDNKIVIKSILERKYEDIISQLLLEKDPVRSEVLKLWAKECKDFIFGLDNLGKTIKKYEGNKTGI